MKKTILMAAVTAVISLSSAAQAGIVYMENFDGLAVGTSLVASNSDWSASADYLVEGSDAHFPTNHLAVTTAAANFNFANWDDGTTRNLLTVSFDVLDPGGMTTATAGLRLATSRATSNASLVDINDATLADNTINHYDIITNISAAAVLYEDGINSVAAGSFDVWVNGVQTVTGGSLVGNGAGDIDGVGLWARRPDAALRVDNFVVRDTAFTATAVPEPSSFAILGLLGLAGVVRRKRVS